VVTPLASTVVFPGMVDVKGRGKEPRGENRGRGGGGRANTRAGDIFNCSHDLSRVFVSLGLSWAIHLFLILDGPIVGPLFILLPNSIHLLSRPVLDNPLALPSSSSTRRKPESQASLSPLSKAPSSPNIRIDPFGSSGPPRSRWKQCLFTHNVQQLSQCSRYNVLQDDIDSNALRF